VNAGTTAVCTIPGQAIAVSNGNCTQLSGTFMSLAYMSATPLPPIAGACAGQTTSDPTKVTETDTRACPVPQTGVPELCAGNAPSGFSACIMTNGDVPCPSGSPFSNRTLVADSMTLACSTCTACSLSATCQNPQLSGYSDTSCQTLLGTIAADNTCVGVMPGLTLTAVVYTASVSTACVGGSSTASLQPVNARTVCCR
jgi:hypothetical protein